MPLAGSGRSTLVTSFTTRSLNASKVGRGSALVKMLGGGTTDWSAGGVGSLMALVQPISAGPLASCGSLVVSGSSGGVQVEVLDCTACFLSFALPLSSVRVLRFLEPAVVEVVVAGSGESGKSERSVHR